MQRYNGPQERENRQSTVLLTKAGPITVLSNPYRQVVACIVPHNVHIHSSTVSVNDILATQPQVQIIPTMENLKEKSFPIVSIVKGMNFALVDLTDAPEVMAALRAGEAPAAKLDEGWDVGIVGCLYYQRYNVEEKEGEPAIHKIHQRMIFQGIEDPGTGSASCALGCYLALTMKTTQSDRKKRHGERNGASTVDSDIAESTKSLSFDDKREHFVFGIVQGIEMGRKSQICVEVDITENEEAGRTVSAVMLSGRSAFVTRGELMSTY